MEINQWNAGPSAILILKGPVFGKRID